jgi:hypothetical protein
LADSLNPEDKAQLSRLEQGLAKLEGDLGKRLAALRSGLATDAQKVARETARGAHEDLVRRQGATGRTTLPTEAEVRRYGQAEIAAGQAVDRRAQQFDRISRLNLRTSQEQLNVMGRTEQLVRLERNLGLERARNLQLLQRQAQQLGVALPGQVSAGRGLRQAESAVRRSSSRPARRSRPRRASSGSCSARARRCDSCSAAVARTSSSAVAAAASRRGARPRVAAASPTRTRSGAGTSAA